MTRLVRIPLAVTLILAPLAAQAADLVVWWDKGQYAEEDAALRETIAAFEQGSGKQVELLLHEQSELAETIEAALELGHPPDFAFGISINRHISTWAFDDRLVDLTDAVGHFADMFDPAALAWWTLLDERTGQRALYALPIGLTTNHVHAWKSLLEQAGFALEDIPKEWNAFWSFWCDQMQPAVRHAAGRDDIWGVGLSMSWASDTQGEFFQFLVAYDADYVTPDGRLIIDDPEVRGRLIEAVDAYTALHRNGCTPPDSVTWDDFDNNRAFLAQTVVMTANFSLSIPNVLKSERAEDYFNNTATISWPLGPDGETFPIRGQFRGGVVFRDGHDVGAAKEFVRFLAGEGWLAHYLDFSPEQAVDEAIARIKQILSE